MAAVIGLDLGTTTLTALALDAERGEVLAVLTEPSRAALTPPGHPSGRSEWDAEAIVAQAAGCLRALAGQLGGRLRDLAGLGLTGQQHGGLVVDGALRPLTPLVNWQDRRGEEPAPGFPGTVVQQARSLVGEGAPLRAGCRLATGYLAVTLFWLKQHGALPAGKACLLMDYAGAILTGSEPVTDPTCAASAGVLDVARGDWDGEALLAL